MSKARKSATKEIELKVSQAYTRDVGRGVVRIDSSAMGALGVITGGVVKIKGNRETYARAIPLYPSDEGRGIIRTDSLIRENSFSQIDDSVYVSKAVAKLAERVIVEPLEAIPPVDERYLAETFDKLPVTIGDKMVMPYFGGRLSFKVTTYTPNASVVVINKKTEVKIVEKNLVDKLEKHVEDLYEKLVTDGYKIKVPKHRFVSALYNVVDLTLDK